MMFAKKISLRIKPVLHRPRPELRQIFKEKLCIISNNICGMQNFLINLGLCLNQPVKILSTGWGVEWVLVGGAKKELHSFNQ
jgi:hypothetical protein